MKGPGVLCLIVLISTVLQAQVAYDSITISRCGIENDWYGKNWADTLAAQQFRWYIKEEKSVWIKPASGKKNLPAVISLINRIKSNGTEDVSKCFIPRHSINFYKQGKIARYLLVCFECDGVRFSDDPKKNFIKNINTRDKQMLELKQLFKDLL